MSDLKRAFDVVRWRHADWVDVVDGLSDGCLA